MEDQKSRKVKYEKPLLIDFMKGTAFGQEFCTTGTGNQYSCDNGYAPAENSCGSGYTAFYECSSGTEVSPST